MPGAPSLTDPALTLRVYAHAMREEENDLSFAEFGSSSKWLQTAPMRKAKSLESPNYAESWCAGPESNPLARFARTRRLSATPPQVRSLLRGRGKTRGYGIPKRNRAE
jgi:hypothetical protein